MSVSLDRDSLSALLGQPLASAYKALGVAKPKPAPKRQHRATGKPRGRPRKQPASDGLPEILLPDGSALKLTAAETDGQPAEQPSIPVWLLTLPPAYRPDCWLLVSGADADADYCQQQRKRLRHWQRVGAIRRRFDKQTGLPKQRFEFDGLPAAVDFQRRGNFIVRSECIDYGYSLAKSAGYWLADDCLPDRAAEYGLPEPAAERAFISRRKSAGQRRAKVCQRARAPHSFYSAGFQVYALPALADGLAYSLADADGQPAPLLVKRAEQPQQQTLAEAAALDCLQAQTLTAEQRAEITLWLAKASEYTGSASPSVWQRLADDISARARAEAAARFAALADGLADAALLLGQCKPKPEQTLRGKRRYAADKQTLPRRDSQPLAAEQFAKRADAAALVKAAKAKALSLGALGVSLAKQQTGCFGRAAEAALLLAAADAAAPAPSADDKPEQRAAKRQQRLAARQDKIASLRGLLPDAAPAPALPSAVSSAPALTASQPQRSSVCCWN